MQNLQRDALSPNLIVSSRFFADSCFFCPRRFLTFRCNFGPTRFFEIFQVRSANFVSSGVGADMPASRLRIPMVLNTKRGAPGRHKIQAMAQKSINRSEANNFSDDIWTHISTHILTYFSAKLQVATTRLRSVLRS